MEGYQITLALVALIIWGLVFIFRRRPPTDKDIEMVLKSFMGQPKDTEQPKDERKPSVKITIEDTDVFENLLMYFRSSSASYNILRILANCEEKMLSREITNLYNTILQKKQRIPLPEHAVRSILMNLYEAKLVMYKDGAFNATQTGRKIISLISTYYN